MANWLDDEFTGSGAVLGRIPDTKAVGSTAWSSGFNNTFVFGGAAVASPFSPDEITYTPSPPDSHAPHEYVAAWSWKSPPPGGIFFGGKVAEFRFGGEVDNLIISITTPDDVQFILVMRMEYDGMSTTDSVPLVLDTEYPAVLTYASGAQSLEMFGQTFELDYQPPSSNRIEQVAVGFCGEAQLSYMRVGGAKTPPFWTEMVGTHEVP
ncbi:hypothetical protein [Polaromonas sp.]|uniref:hypothetical protein n=1 Tax=Polaromonas sp. TaxID=1869339 RepID=UPI00326600B7